MREPVNGPVPFCLLDPRYEEDEITDHLLFELHNALAHEKFARLDSLAKQMSMEQYVRGIIRVEWENAKQVETIIEKNQQIFVTKYISSIQVSARLTAQEFADEYSERALNGYRNRWRQLNGLPPLPPPDEE